MKFLYGLSVQGIQSFIFETDKLKEIVGGSAFIEKLCTDLFEEKCQNFHSPNLLQGAAGNVKYLFDNEKECANMVLTYPMELNQIMPGLVVSQAVEKIEEQITKKHLNNLETKLGHQRNLPSAKFQAPMLAAKSQRTGDYGVDIDKVESTNENLVYLSRHQQQKRKWYSEAGKILTEKLRKQDKNLFPEDIEDISGKASNKDAWIAIVHLDGNNLGKVIRKILEKHDVSRFTEFSTLLDKATILSAREAFAETFKDHPENTKYPFRPILLGGDDLTLIIKANKAIIFTELYLNNFEKYTKEKLSIIAGDDFTGLTACAGIAFIKPNYPFHYGATLSEQLCKHAKNISKKINDSAPSSVMFHFVHSSFIDESFQETIERELTSLAGNFAYGPYLLNSTSSSSFATIEQLKGWVQIMLKDDTPKTQLRTLINQFYENKDKAVQYHERLISLDKVKNIVKELELEKVFKERNIDGNISHVSHLNDIIRLASLK